MTDVLGVIPWGELAFCIPICAVSCWLIERAVGAVIGRLRMSGYKRRPTHCPSCASKLINPAGLLHPCEYTAELYTKRGDPCGQPATHVINTESGGEIHTCDECLYDTTCQLAEMFVVTVL